MRFCWGLLGGPQHGIWYMSAVDSAPSHWVILSWSSLFLSVNVVPVHLSIYLSVILEMTLKNFGKLFLTINYLPWLTVFSIVLISPPHIAFLLLAWPHGDSNFGGVQTLHRKILVPKMVSAGLVALSVILWAPSVHQNCCKSTTKTSWTLDRAASMAYIFFGGVEISDKMYNSRCSWIFCN